MFQTPSTPTILHDISNSVTLSQSSKIKIKIVLKKSNRQKKSKEESRIKTFNSDCSRSSLKKGSDMSCLFSSREAAF